MPECRERVGKGVVTFSCSVPVPAGASSHEGPCAAIEVPRTMKQRENWEAEQRHQASGLAEFQGRAQTTAERYTDGATDPPGTEAPQPEPRVVRAGGVGEALDRAGVPPHVATEASQEAPQPTKAGRKHDQPMPVVNDRPAVQDQLIVEIERRKKIGVERYGTLLQPFNGRSAIRDAFEESLDLTIYLRQVLAEQDEVAERTRHIRDLLDPPKPYTDTPPVSDDTRDQVLMLLDDLLELLGQ
jgi:hypothetical protein